MTNTTGRFLIYCLSASIFTLLFSLRPAMARECIDCHADVLTHFKGTSHHVQGVRLTGKHCYACHWEATVEGRINKRYHTAKSVKKSALEKNSKVDLVVWSRGKRPSIYKLYSSAVTFQASKINTSAEREEVARITTHCLGCHSDQNNETLPFAGDTRTPRSYAWDGQSVASRYSRKDITTWGKYSTTSTNKRKRVTKSFSAHGNAARNLGGWSASGGYDYNIPVTRGGSGARNVECFDCHNSHGSSVSGITTSYRGLDGAMNGGILKETSAGKGGYRMTYKPSVNYDQKSKNPYNAGAGICFDCHETAKSGTTPWGYSSTFGAGQPIIGYKDTLRFGPGNKGSTDRYSNRQSRTEIASSHLKAVKFLNYSAHGRINGLCTPCHDPHGISRTLVEKMQYAVPLLKGTWLTSPYLEDAPPTSLPGRVRFAKRDGSGNLGMTWKDGDFNFTNRETNANFGVGGAGSAREPMSMPGMKYNVDRNTFGAERWIVEDDDSFAGVCLRCHPRENFTGANKTGRIHRTVKGWGGNKEHSFPCSKCHQSHSSGLPRLMQTNCFEQGPPGLRENSGLSWLPDRKGENNSPEQGRQPSATSSKNKKPAKGELVGCHVRQFGKR